MTPLYISIPVLVWLSVCAWFDWKSRRVSNWLTLPMLLASFLVRVLGYGTGDWRFVWLLSILVILAWAAALFGGADAKASLGMIMLDPRLAVWAWAGSVIWYFALLIFTCGRKNLIFVPGIMGFLIGVITNICLSLIL